MADGEIHDVAQAGGKVFAAGTFTRITSWTGGLARTDGSSGALVRRAPWIEGEVSVLASDGSGGWYVGGEFDRSDGGACRNLVHVNGSGRIETRFCARVDQVLAVALAGGRLYIGTGCCADVAESVIAVDPETGVALDWTLDIEGGYDDSADQDRNTLGPGIHALASDGETLYVGGFFDELGGEQRTHLAALHGRTGAVLPWNPPISSARALSGGVEALAASESSVAVAAGRFLDGQKILLR